MEKLSKLNPEFKKWNRFHSLQAGMKCKFNYFRLSIENYLSVTGSTICL